MKTTSWIIAIVLIIFVILGIYFLTQGTVKTPVTPNPSLSPNPNPTPTPTHSDLMGSIANNHGHTVVLTAAQQDAGQAVTLQLTIGSGHTHTLSLTAAQVKEIADGKTVSATSSTNSGHSHVVTFN